MSITIQITHFWIAKADTSLVKMPPWCERERLSTAPKKRSSCLFHCWLLFICWKRLTSPMYRASYVVLCRREYWPVTIILQVFYSRVMDKETSHNILTELKMTSDQYNLVTNMYYVGNLGPKKAMYSQLILRRPLISSRKPHPISYWKACVLQYGRPESW